MPNKEKPKKTSIRQPIGIMVTRTQAMPRDTNANGDIFGGWIMSQMDIGGGLLAREVAFGRVVTVTVDKMAFVRPVHVGDIICVYADVLRIGNTSLDLKVEVWAKDLLDEFQEQRHVVTEAVFRYVAVDETGRPRPIPDNTRFPRSNVSETGSPIV